LKKIFDVSKQQMCRLCNGIVEINDEQILDVCPNVTEIPVLNGVTKLVVSDNKNVTEIPIIPGLLTLQIVNCPNIKKIPLISTLDELVLSGCIVENIPLFPVLRDLFCSNCPRLKEIPVMENVKDFTCVNCNFKIPVFPNLDSLALCNVGEQEIGPYTKLTHLSIHTVNIIKFSPIESLKILDIRCINNQTLPNLPNLTRLSVDGLVSLKNFPESLEELSFCGMKKLTIPALPRLQALSCSSCEVESIPYMPSLKNIRLLFCNKDVNIPFVFGQNIVVIS
jgi:hypothetical protein